MALFSRTAPELSPDPTRESLELRCVLQTLAQLGGRRALGGTSHGFLPEVQTSADQLATSQPPCCGRSGFATAFRYACERSGFATAFRYVCERSDFATAFRNACERSGFATAFRYEAILEPIESLNEPILEPTEDASAQSKKHETKSTKYEAILEPIESLNEPILEAPSIGTARRRVGAVGPELTTETSYGPPRSKAREGALPPSRL